MLPISITPCAGSMRNQRLAPAASPVARSITALKSSSLFLQGALDPGLNLANAGRRRIRQIVEALCLGRGLCTGLLRARASAARVAS
jgi:hypothetical protein